MLPAARLLLEGWGGSNSSAAPGANDTLADTLVYKHSRSGAGYDGARAPAASPAPGAAAADGANDTAIAASNVGDPTPADGNASSSGTSSCPTITLVLRAMQVGRRRRRPLHLLLPLSPTCPYLFLYPG